MRSHSRSLALPLSRSLALLLFCSFALSLSLFLSLPLALSLSRSLSMRTHLINHCSKKQLNVTINQMWCLFVSHVLATGQSLIVDPQLKLRVYAFLYMYVWMCVGTTGG